MATAKKSIRKIAQYNGFYGIQRVLTKADQNAIAGVKSGIGKEDLVWATNNGKLDVTDVHPEVLSYIESATDEWTVRDVEVDAEESTPTAPAS